MVSINDAQLAVLGEGLELRMERIDLGDAFHEPAASQPLIRRIRDLDEQYGRLLCDTAEGEYLQALKKEYGVK